MRAHSFKKLFLIPVLLGCVSTAYSQKQVGLNIDDHLLIKSANRNLNGVEDTNIDGTPYLTDEFASGIAYTAKGKYNPLPMRYDIFHDVVEFQRSNLVFLLDPSPEIRKVAVGDNTLVVQKYELKGKPHFGFLILLDSGKVSLLLKKQIDFKEGRAAGALEAASVPPKYVEASDVYFYKIGDQQPVRIESLKSMIAQFPDRQTELNEFAKKKKISPRKKEDLIELVKYYNSL